MGVLDMDCGYCGKPVPEELRFCPACGAPVGQKPHDQQTAALTSVRPAATAAQPRVQYIPPDDNAPLPPPPAPPRGPLFWVGIAAVAVLVILLAVLIPILVTGGGDDAVTTTTGASTTTLAPATTTSQLSTTTTLPGTVGDSAGSWTEATVPGGPWAAQEVAISEDALLVVTQAASGYKLSAIMLGSGQVIKVSQSEVIAGLDIDGRLAVWWEASGWDAATETYSKQYIRSCLLPTGTKKTIATGGTARMGQAQVASPWVSWVLSEPWVDNPDEYWTERIMAVKVDDAGAAVGSAVTLVPSALAFALGDSGWQYSLSSTQIAWENGAAIPGYGVGVHVMQTDTSGHQSLGEEAWRPSLWGDLLVYQDGNLKATDLGTGSTGTIDPSGDFATAGPTFATYYKPSTAGSFLVVRGYTGAHEQTLGELSQPPYFCPAVSVSATHIAYAFEDTVYVFVWQAQ
jgi:hypothetical protein